MIEELCWAKNQRKHSRKGLKADEDILFLQHSNVLFRSAHVCCLRL